MKLAEFTTGNDPVADGHAAGLRDMVRNHARHAPRSQQTALGPSEIGQDCPRRMAYRLMGEERVNADSDPWPAYVGTAVHAELEQAAQHANQQLGRVRYLTETRVTVRDGLFGSCDLFDGDHAVATDHKIIGETAMRRYKRDGPPYQYRAQAHLYGVGLGNLGLTVKHVAIAFFPRGGMLSGLHVWTEPFDPTVADAALARHDQILEAACALDVDTHPDNYAHIPAAPGHACTWCPFFQPGSSIGRTCPGHMAA